MSKILLISDSPYATTGLGRMARYFMQMLPEHEWIHWGVNHTDFKMTAHGLFADYNSEDFNGNFKIVSPRIFGDDDAYQFKYLPHVIQKEKPDYIITSLDFNRIFPFKSQLLELKMTLGFEWINYFPVDRELIIASEVKTIEHIDHNIVITKHGLNKIKSIDNNINIKQIYHPIDSNEFTIIGDKKKKELRNKIFGNIARDKIIIGTVNRNFARKDPVKLIQAFVEFKKNVPNSILYFHGSSMTNEKQDLRLIAHMLGLRGEDVVFTPQGYTEIAGVSNSELNEIYNCIDIFVTASMGEGFGFTTVEALLTGTPIVAPSNTSFPELINDNGYLVPIDLIDSFEFNYGLYDIPWQRVKTTDLAKGLLEVYNNLDLYKNKAIKGREWVIDNLNFEKIKKQWSEIIK